MSLNPFVLSQFSQTTWNHVLLHILSADVPEDHVFACSKPTGTSSIFTRRIDLSALNADPRLGAKAPRKRKYMTCTTLLELYALIISKDRIGL